jgi:hypothetical protein
MARLGGIFPFPIANVAEGGTRIDLPSGGVFVLPPNQYIVATDANSQMQYWDPQSTSWQTLWGHSSGGNITADGTNYRLLNDTGVISAGTIANGTAAGLTNGIGPVTGVTAALSAPGAGGIPGTAYVIVGGSVAAPTVTQAGTGFLAAPVVVIDPPPIGGIQATAHAVLTGAGGGISSIVMDNVGAGYIGPPNFWLIPQNSTYAGGPSGGGAFAAAVFPPLGTIYPTNAVPGNQNIGPTGAQLTSVALTGSGLITGFVRVNWGALYAGTPTVALANSLGGSLGTAAITLAAVTAAAVATALITPRIAE